MALHFVICIMLRPPISLTHLPLLATQLEVTSVMRSVRTACSFCVPQWHSVAPLRVWSLHMFCWQMPNGSQLAATVSVHQPQRISPDRLRPRLLDFRFPSAV